MLRDLIYAVSSRLLPPTLGGAVARRLALRAARKASSRASMARLFSIFHLKYPGTKVQGSSTQSAEEYFEVP
jgi:hypothetical protein